MNRSLLDNSRRDTAGSERNSTSREAKMDTGDVPCSWVSSLDYVVYERGGTRIRSNEELG